MFSRLLTLIRELEPNQHFLKLWLSQALSLTAFNMVNFTLLLRVFDLTHSAIMVSLYVLSFGLPSLFFGAIAGVFADRWNRRNVLIATNVLRTIIVLAFLPALDNLGIIFAATFVMATVTQFFTPAEGAMIPDLVERKRLVAANAVFMVTLFGSFVLGYGIAGPLAGIGGDSLPIIIASVMFGLATIACTSLPKLKQKTHLTKISEAYRSLFEQLKGGFRVVRENAPVRYGLKQLTLIWATIGVVMVVVPVYTSQVLELNLREISRLIILPIGIGMILGGYVLHRARRQFGTRSVVAVSIILTGLAIIALGQINMLTHWLQDIGIWQHNEDAARQLITSMASTVLGFGASIVMIASQTLIHEHTAPAVRGRIFGVLGMSINAANTIPVIVAGALTDIFSVTAVVTGVGGILVIWGALAPVSARRG
ncbi:MFS transporter [Patescibacteria group bacterium]|nr:MFS transporter [Patescibacteria group bacterium]